MYAQEGMVFVNKILEHSAEEKIPKQLSCITLGWIIKDVFGEEACTVQRGPKGSTQRAYL